MSLIGKVLNERYEITGLLGEGGLARVYRALDLKDGGVVAVKVVEPRGKSQNANGNASVAEEQLRERFEREVEINQRLSGKSVHILPFNDSGMHMFEDMAVLYLAMPIVEGGKTLDNVFEDYLGKHAANKPITGSFVPLPKLLDLMLQAGQGLRDAHACKVVHRDFKPSNVLIRIDARGRETALVMDFGIARYYDAQVESQDREKDLTQLGSCVGTIVYMSPQQGYGPKPDKKQDMDRYDPRNDIWSFGEVLFQGLTGHLPFPYQEQNLSEVWAQVYHGTIKPATVSQYCEGIPRELENLVAKCLEHELADRPSSMEEVLAVMQRVQLKLPSSGPLVEEPPLLVPARRKSDAFAPTESTDSDPPKARKTPASSPSIESASLADASLLIQATAKRSSAARIVEKKDAIPPPPLETEKKSHPHFGALLLLVLGAVVFGLGISYLYQNRISQPAYEVSAPRPSASASAPPVAQALPSSSVSATPRASVAPSGPAKYKPRVPFDTKRSHDPTSAPE